MNIYYRGDLMAFIPIILFLAFPGRVSFAARSALSMCAVSVIPSLFPFMAAAKCAVLSGDINEDNGFFRLIARIFGISPAGVWSLLSGLICGYPTGAKTAFDLCREGRISKREAVKLSCFCNNGGPAFIISVVGGGFLRSTSYGIIIYLCHITASLLTGLALRKLPVKKAPPRKKELPRGIMWVLPEALLDSASGILNVTGIIVFFAALLEVIKGILPMGLTANPVYDGMFCGLFEITSGIKSLASSPVDIPLKLSLITFLMSFSGFSVIMQSLSFARGLNIKTAPCILCKTLSACLSAILCYFFTIAILFLERAS